MAARSEKYAALMLCVAGLAACSGMPTSQATKDLEVAPQYSQEQKDAMSEEQKVALYNESMSQEKDRVVCRRERPIGSHISRTVCRTRAEIEQDREMSRESLRKTGRELPWDPLPPGGQ